ncbi:MAG: prolyl oligopeptidase family serine peptidase [bacterium]|nr:prolyl oligopeptidase family serine peptidase [bacterium]
MRRHTTIFILMLAHVSGIGFAGDKSLTLDKIFGETSILEVDSPQAVRWMPDGKSFIYRLASEEGEVLWSENVQSGEKKKLANWSQVMDQLREQRPGRKSAVLRDVNSASSSRYNTIISPDGSMLVGLVAGDLYTLTLDGGSAKLLTNDSTEELFPTFSPNGDWLAFIRDGDLYCLTLADASLQRLTHRGDKTHILNGMADWVAEEELGVRRSFWWSPDGTKIAFVQYDTSPIDVFPITDELDLYAGLEQQRYPKAGTANSKLQLGVVTLDGNTSWMNLGQDEDIYVVRAGWMPDGASVWYQRLNRDQTTLDLVAADPTTGEPRPLLRDFDPTWVNVRDDLLFLDDGRFLWTSERDGRRHLYLHAADGSLIQQLTEGDWQVEAVYGLDSSGTRMLMQGTGEDPRDRHIYAVGLDGSAFRRLSSEAGSHRADLAPGGGTYLATYSSLATPPKLELRRSNGELLRIVDEGKIPALADYQLSPIEMGTLKADDGTTLYSAMIRPPDFDPEKRYPVLLYVYGGMHAQLVQNSWGGSRHLFYRLLAQEGIIVYWLDNRGTWARGKAFESVVHRRLGQLEVADQLAGVRHLKSLSYVDPDRIGVYGGSYGGYLTLMCMLSAPDVFRAGIAYAPVTDWRLYDSVYTERYMDTPQDNPEGYDAGAPLLLADKLKGRLLIVHGSMDNNVHTQQSLQMIKKLTDAGKQFEFMLYPRGRHGIRVSDYRLHFHRLKTDFLLEHLKGNELANGP